MTVLNAKCSGSRSLPTDTEFQLKALAEIKETVLGCNDCAKFENMAYTFQQQVTDRQEVVVQLQSQCQRLQSHVSSAQGQHDHTEHAYRTLYEEAESCYGELCESRKLYHKAESFVHTQVPRIKDQADAAQGEVARLNGELQQSNILLNDAQNEAVNIAKREANADTVPKATFEKLHEHTKKIIAQINTKLAFNRCEVEKLNVEINQKDNKICQLQYAIDNWVDKDSEDNQSDQNEYDAQSDELIKELDEVLELVPRHILGPMRTY